MKQQTISTPVTLEGVGLHTGKAATLRILPAGVHHGIKFKRTDLEGAPIVVAAVENVVSTNRSTTIAQKEVKVVTTEHLLAAFAGLQIDNALIEITGEEVPILDGSSLPFLNALQLAGIEEQDAEKDFLIIEEPFTFTDEASGATFMLAPSADFSLTTLIDFNSEVLGQQFATLEGMAAFEKSIAPARTFAFLHEIEFLLENNLIKGGDLDNAVVIVDKPLSEAAIQRLEEKTGKSGIAVKQGVLNTTELRFGNEAARHKLLDVVGDLMLVGRPIQGKIIASKPGHTGNVALATQLKALYNKQRKLKGKPKYDPTQKPVYDINKIASMLPHRYPFLLVDKIIELTDTYVVGVKNVTFNEEFFQGHFPNNPVMPGVLQIEALAQTGGILALSMVEEPEKWDTYFLKIDNVKFKAKVVPGDTLIFKMELLSPIRRGIVHMKGTTYVGDILVSEGELTAQIVKSR
jgi:UDP-3-O-[3-hydroxymyristoyl] N-acetylglucosamine deacetylase / 3-hydroxyacyl-[acyl-carrier-protein] dehydratase